MTLGQIYSYDIEFDWFIVEDKSMEDPGLTGGMSPITQVEPVLE